MKKTISLILFLILALALAFAFTSCGDSDENPEEEGGYDFTKILDFELSESKDYYIVTGYGVHTNSVVEIPAEHEGKPVKEIGRKAFSSATLSTGHLKEIIIPASVTSIGDYAFADCELLEKVTIKGAVTKIGIAAFRSCKALTTISLPEGLVEISDYAFDLCTNLEPITIPSTVTNIGFDVFRACPKITGTAASTNFNGVYTLSTPGGKWVVRAERTITDANLPDNTIGIAGGAFKNCNSLVVVEIPKNVKYICKAAFDGASELTTVNYGGTREAWLNIKIGEDNFPILNATINYNE